MSLVTLLLAVLLGCAGAGIGWLLARLAGRAREPQHTARLHRLAAGVAGGLAAALAPALAATPVGDGIAFGLRLKSKSELLLAEAIAPIVRDPRVAAGLDGKDATFAASYAAELTSRGIALLPAPELERWATLRLRLAEASPAYCAGAWRGGLAPADVHRALDALTDEERRRWAELVMRAGRLALDTPPSPTPSGRALLEGMLALAESLPAAARAEFDRDVVLADPGPERACELFQLVMRRALALAPAEREALLRALAAQHAQ